MFYLFYRIIIFGLNKAKDETVNSHNLETANHIAHKSKRSYYIIYNVFLNVFIL